jgi:regulator of replication initiation timing
MSTTSEQEIKVKIVRIYELMDEVNDLKDSIKDRQAEVDDLYTEIIQYMDETGNSQLETDDGIFQVKKSLKYTKNKKSGKSVSTPKKVDG